MPFSRDLRTIHLAGGFNRCNIRTVMLRAFRQDRSRRFRLLASLLVIMAILCNGIGLAQAHATDAEKDCCAEMTGHGKSLSHCDEGAKSPHAGCDDQCMARCMTANALLSIPTIIASNALITSPLPRLTISEHALTEPSPGLRPPIYS